MTIKTVYGVAGVVAMIRCQLARVRRASLKRVKLQ